jgi:SAM-dependent methyltransferase
MHHFFRMFAQIHGGKMDRFVALEDYLPHHNPFQYYRSWFSNVQAGHMRDGTDFFEDLKSGKLPSVSFVKATGARDEHPANSAPRWGDRFDAAIMALVIFFVPDPAKGVAEMVRVVAPGGTVATYAWDMLGGGFPGEPIHAEMRAMGLTPLLSPSAGASRIETLRELWTGSGLDAVETREIAVERNFTDFDEFWTINLMSPNMGPAVAAMARGDAERLKAGVRARLPADAAGRITYAARANAAKGRMSK